MLESTLFAHFTVPHSGTRYINHCVQDALNTKAYQVGSERAWHRTKDKGQDQRFMFCHIGERYYDWLSQVIEQGHIKTWITVRSPIMTWGTHWGVVKDSLEDGRHIQTYEKLGQMRGQFESLIELAPQVGYIHRIEDDLDGLSAYLGLDLKAHERTHSNPTGMKKALIYRDLDKVKELCEGHDFYNAFHDYITPDIKDFFEDLGYDIWWHNG